MIRIISSWEQQKSVEEHFAKFFSVLDDSRMDYLWFRVERSRRHHMLWTFTLDGQMSNKTFTKGLQLTMVDMETALEDEAAAQRVAERLCDLPWKRISLYEITPDPPLFELSETSNVPVPSQSPEKRTG